MTEMCKWLHHELESLPFIQYPFELTNLPQNGIYFFYEKDEISDHGYGSKPRIVRIGTHKQGNFRSRISDHFLFNTSKMKFAVSTPKPSDRSIFRKNIGRALLCKEGDEYLQIWNKDFTSHQSRLENANVRNIVKEHQIESQITDILYRKFSFRYIVLDSEEKRMGLTGLESKLIGTVSHCPMCRPSEKWLGRYSPLGEISHGKLWLSFFLNSIGITTEDQEFFSSLLRDTREWIERLS